MSTEERKVPELRFKGFSDDWEQRKFKEILKVNSGRDYKHLSLGNIPVFGTGGYMLSVNDKLSSQDAVGIGRKGTINKPQFLKAPFWTVDTLFFVTSNKLTDIQFLYFLFQKINWLKFDESTGVPSLSKNTIEGIITKLPMEKEQSKIGNMLKIFDYIVDLHQRKFNILQKLKKVYLRKMFADHVNKRPNLRFKYFEEEWKLSKLGDLGSTFTGLQGKSKVDFGHGSAYYVPYTNIFNNLFVDTNQLEKIEIDSKQNSLKYGDVLFTTSSETPVEVGMSSIWLGKMSNVYLNSFCFGYRLNAPINLYFLAFSLRSPYFRRKMSVLAQGISRYNISKTKVMDSLISVPETTEQKYIGEFLKGLEKAIDFHNSKIKKIKELKKEYLNKMFI